MFYASNWAVDFLLINMRKKEGFKLLLSREEISSRKAPQAGELHSQLPVRQLKVGKSLGREIPAAFTHHTRCMRTRRSLTTGVVGHKLASTAHL